MRRVSSPRMEPYNTHEYVSRQELECHVARSVSSSGGGHFGPPDRLINVETMNIESLDDFNITPEYAILSHTWERGEATLSDWRTGRQAALPGYKKILAACEQAKKDGLKYLWADTCCIDKRSSTELGSAINSMYNWYKRSAVCYAFLADVRVQKSCKRGDGSGWVSHYDLARAKWFTRGWTLQELLASEEVQFFAADWTNIGNLESLLPSIADITGIDRRALSHKWPLHCFSTAQKFSWASNRKTTRPEDKAYCMIGLFDISLPATYGIGRRAFQLLQEEIIRQSEELDDSIFVWDTSNERRQGTLLATSPKDFKNGGDIERDFDSLSSFWWSGGRVHGTFWLIAHDRNDSWDGHCALLNCKLRDRDDKQLGLLIKRVEAGYNGSVDATYAISPKSSRRGSRSSRTVLVDEGRRDLSEPFEIEIIPDAIRSRRERPIGTMSSHLRRLESMTSLSEYEPLSRYQSTTPKRGRSSSNASTSAPRSTSRHGCSRSSSHGSGSSLPRIFSSRSDPRRSSSRLAPSRTVQKKSAYLWFRQETSRPLNRDEALAFSAFENHAHRCRECHDPGEVLHLGYELCRTGQRLGDSVDSYAYSKRGKILSSESTRRWRVFLKIPKQHQQVLDYLHHVAV